MNKERTAFLIVISLLALIFFLGGDDPARRGGRFRPGGSLAEALEPVTNAGMFLQEGERAWDASADARNVFLAPRETSDLPLLPLLPPPPPRLQHPGLPLVPAVGGPVRRALRHPLMPESIDVRSNTNSRVSSPDPSEAGDGVDPLDALLSDPGFALSLSDKLRMDTEAKLARERAQAEARQSDAERRRGLDSVTWPNQDVGFGRVEALTADTSRYDIKLAIDRLRSDSGLSEAERRRALTDLRFVFFEDKGRDRRPSRMPLTGENVQRIEFASNDAVAKFELRKRQAAADDLSSQWALADVLWQGRTAGGKELDLLVRHLEGLLAKGMSSAAIYGRLADAHRLLLRYDREIAVLQDAFAAGFDEGELWARYGGACFRLRLMGEAEAAFSKALEKEPGQGLPHLGRGRALLEQGEFGDAEGHLRQAIAGGGMDNETRREAQVLLGNATLAQGNLRAARQAFQGSVDAYGATAEALAGLIVVTLVESGASAAMPLADAGRDSFPLSGTLAYLQGVIRLRMENWSGGLESLTVAKELDPFLTAVAQIALSYLQEKSGRDEAALSEVDLALVADPLCLEATLQRARCLLNVGDYRAAIGEYQRVLTEDPGRPDILVALGDASFQIGEVGDAGRYYERAAREDADFPQLLPRRLIARVRGRDRGEAEELVKGVDAQTLRDPFVQAAMAYYHYDRGTPQETVQIFQRLGEKKEGHSALLEYANRSVEQIRENLAKERWRDDFNRSGSKILLGWKTDVGAGPSVSLNQQRIAFAGRQTRISGKPTVLYQERPGRAFDSFSVDLETRASPGTFTGIGLIAFQRIRAPEPYEGIQERGDEFPYHGIQVAVAPEGDLRFRVLEKGVMGDWKGIEGAEFSLPTLSLGLELADEGKSLFRILVNGTAVQTVNVPSLARFGRSVELQVFGQASIDRPLEFTVDNATIITRKGA